VRKTLGCLVAAVLLAGCSGGGGSTATASRAPSTGSPAGPSSPEPSSPSSSSSSSAPKAAAVKQQTARVLGKLKGTVVLGVSAVQVRGKLATVELTFSPTVPEEPADKTVSLYDVNGGQPVTMTLVDTMNLKRYAVVQDANGRDLQPQEVGLSTLPGGSATGTYTFAAPPSGVTAIDVYFANFPPFRDVPVSR